LKHIVDEGDAKKNLSGPSTTQETSPRPEDFFPTVPKPNPSSSSLSSSSSANQSVVADFFGSTTVTAPVDPSAVFANDGDFSTIDPTTPSNANDFFPSPSQIPSQSAVNAGDFFPGASSTPAAALSGPGSANVFQFFAPIPQQGIDSQKAFANDDFSQAKF